MLVVEVQTSISGISERGARPSPLVKRPWKDVSLSLSYTTSLKGLQLDSLGSPLRVCLTLVYLLNVVDVLNVSLAPIRDWWTMWRLCTEFRYERSTPLPRNCWPCFKTWEEDDREKTCYKNTIKEKKMLKCIQANRLWSPLLPLCAHIEWAK